MLPFIDIHGAMEVLEMTRQEVMNLVKEEKLRKYEDHMLIMFKTADVYKLAGKKLPGPIEMQQDFEQDDERTIILDEESSEELVRELTQQLRNPLMLIPGSGEIVSGEDSDRRILEDILHRKNPKTVQRGSVVLSIVAAVILATLFAIWYFSR